MGFSRGCGHLGWAGIVVVAGRGGSQEDGICGGHCNGVGQFVFIFSRTGKNFGDSHGHIDAAVLLAVEVEVVLSIFRWQYVRNNLIDAVIVDFGLVNNLRLELDGGFFKGGESGFKGIILHVFIIIVIFVVMGNIA